MDNISKIIQWLRQQPKWLKSLAIIIIALCCILMLFSSCSSIRSTIPSISENQIGAEGVISKEKNVTRQTKWFFKPEFDSVTLNTY